MTTCAQNSLDEDVRVLNRILQRSRPVFTAAEQPAGHSFAPYPSLPMTFDEGMAMMRAWGARATPWTWDGASKVVCSER